VFFPSSSEAYSSKTTTKNINLFSGQV